MIYLRCSCPGKCSFNCTSNLYIPEYILGKMSKNTDVECLDTIDQILLNYSIHPSILKIKVFVKPTETFSFNKADEKEIEKEILELSSKNLPVRMQFHQKLLKIPLVCSSHHLPNSLTPPISNMLILHPFIRNMTIQIKRIFGHQYSPFNFKNI